MKLFSKLSGSSADEWAHIERHLPPAEPLGLPPGLHQQIMRAVKNISPEAASGRSWWPVAFAGASACILVAMAVWLSIGNSAGEKPQASVMPSLSSDLSLALSTNLVSPLALELVRVESDMRDAAQGLLSALPQFPSGE